MQSSIRVPRLLPQIKGEGAETIEVGQTRGDFPSQTEVVPHLARNQNCCAWPNSVLVQDFPIGRVNTLRPNQLSNRPVASTQSITFGRANVQLVNSGVPNRFPHTLQVTQPASKSPN